MGQVRNFNGRDPDATRQGFYAFDAEGHVYGAMNRRAPERLLRLLERAQREYAERDHGSLALSSSVPVTRPRPPVGSTVLRVHARIGPLERSEESDRAEREERGRGRRREGSGRTSWRNSGVGRDFVWVRPEEVRSLRAGRIPDAFAGRLLLLHCLDSIRGEPDPWSADDVRYAQLEVVERRVTRGGTVVVARGDFLVEKPEREGGDRRPLPPTGYEGTIEARIEFDTAGDLTSWTMIVEGEAWGRGRYTGGEPNGRFPLRI
ncbi:MAG: hypothetical protein KDC38_11875, partial [Planctomycetes bacterium]|nr:hypothetical protein [Planctomycetota bacterium]